MNLLSAEGVRLGSPHVQGAKILAEIAAIRTSGVHSQLVSHRIRWFRSASQADVAGSSPVARSERARRPASDETFPRPLAVPSLAEPRCTCAGARVVRPSAPLGVKTHPS
jgi:hypothetical protein